MNKLNEKIFRKYLTNLSRYVIIRYTQTKGFDTNDKRKIYRA